MGRGGVQGGAHAWARAGKVASSSVCCVALQNELRGERLVPCEACVRACLSFSAWMWRAHELLSISSSTLPPPMMAST